jgi:hypothetical protein
MYDNGGRDPAPDNSSAYIAAAAAAADDTYSQHSSHGGAEQFGALLQSYHAAAAAAEEDDDEGKEQEQQQQLRRAPVMMPATQQQLFTEAGCLVALPSVGPSARQSRDALLPLAAALRDTARYLPSFCSDVSVQSQHRRCIQRYMQINRADFELDDVGNDGLFHVMTANLHAFWRALYQQNGALADADAATPFMWSEQQHGDGEGRPLGQRAREQARALNASMCMRLASAFLHIVQEQQQHQYCSSSNRVVLTELVLDVCIRAAALPQVSPMNRDTFNHFVLLVVCMLQSNAGADSDGDDGLSSAALGARLAALRITTLRYFKQRYDDELDCERALLLFQRSRQRQDHGGDDGDSKSQQQQQLHGGRHVFKLTLDEARLKRHCTILSGAATQVLARRASATAYFPRKLVNSTQSLSADIREYTDGVRSQEQQRAADLDAMRLPSDRKAQQPLLRPPSAEQRFEGMQKALRARAVLQQRRPGTAPLLHRPFTSKMPVDDALASLHAFRTEFRGGEPMIVATQSAQLGATAPLTMIAFGQTGRGLSDRERQVALAQQVLMVENSRSTQQQHKQQQHWKRYAAQASLPSTTRPHAARDRLRVAHASAEISASLAATRQLRRQRPGSAERVGRASTRGRPQSAPATAKKQTAAAACATGATAVPRRHIRWTDFFQAPVPRQRRKSSASYNLDEYYARQRQQRGGGGATTTKKSSAATAAAAGANLGSMFVASARLAAAAAATQAAQQQQAEGKEQRKTVAADESGGDDDDDDWASSSDDDGGDITPESASPLSSSAESDNDDHEEAKHDGTLQ